MVKVGHKINGRYKILGNVGSGGMANVFLADDLILERQVAVKMLRFDFQNDQIAIRRFQREALSASELVHPNIVGVYDVGEEDGMQFLVMEYVKGTDLKQYIQGNHPLAVGTVVRIMEQILSGVALAHQHHIIHRDLKPQNILMDEAGNVKIADFGIAVALSETSLTQTNTMLGSVHYLSPEQARGGMATRQSDIYALGIILYELLAGRVPFEGESAVSIALKHFQSNLPSVRSMNVSIPQALENVIFHATAKEPQNRYLTAAEMELDISTALDSARMSEEVFVPRNITLDETKAMPAVTDSDMPDSFREMTTMGSGDKGKNELSANRNDEEFEEPTKKKKWPWVLLLLLLATISGFAFLGLSGNKTIKMPDLSDKTVAEARQTISDLGLVLDEEIETIADEKIAEGKVVKTIPKAGIEVKKAREIKLYVSSGSKKISLKDYTNKKYQEVYDELIALGFDSDRISKTEEYSEDVSEGKIMAQDIDANTEVDPKEDSLNFTVSLGTELITLGDYTGKTYDTVYNELIALGFGDEQIIKSEEGSDTILEGLVIATKPISGEKVNPKTDVVKVIVSSGADLVSLKNMVGYSKKDAQTEIEKSELEYNENEEWEYSDTHLSGSVISHTPSGSQKVPKGTVVTFTISKGPKPTEETRDTQSESDVQNTSETDARMR